MSPQVSIIIPIYNEEKRLARCLDSVIEQTHRNLEIILVNDGSTDRSLDICRAYAKKDSRIRLISQSNQGLSAARNTGIDISSSAFVQFVDGDDYLLPTMTETLMNALLAEDASAAQCDFHIVRDTVTVDCAKNIAPVPSLTTYRGKEISFLLENDYLRTVVQWNKLFRRELFCDLRYPIGKYHEDEFLIHRELASMTAITYVDSKLYCYVRHHGSITHKKAALKSVHICEALMDRFAYYADIHELDLAGRAYLRLLQRIKRELAYLVNESDSNECIEKLRQLRENANKISNTRLAWRTIH